MKEVYDVVVVGAGHASCEAAHAAAKMGCSTLLITTSWDAVSVFACNPSIGGPGRGQLVMEIGALGGVMAVAADSNVISSKISGESSGPAARTVHQLVDKNSYPLYMKIILESTKGLSIYQDMASNIESSAGRLMITTRLGESIEAKTIVLAAGTFLNGTLSMAGKKQSSGRYGEISSSELVDGLRRKGLRFKRFKTGTSPRINISAINIDKMEERAPREPVARFAYWKENEHREQQSYYVTRTNGETHLLVKEALSSDYTEELVDVSPRHCPSIAAKLMRFPERNSHPVFVQPMSNETNEGYLQGLSMSLPPSVQEKIIRTIPGLESAEIIRPGYSVAYDYLIPDQLKATLETKAIEGLFTAGQINGTSGYEEAAAQGLMAGINAALKVKGDEPLLLDRSVAYIGVLVDDLVTKGVDEPYRMFTSRAEYRLRLRSDNADVRLVPAGHKLGLVEDGTMSRVEKKLAAKLSDANLPDDFIQFIEARELYSGLEQRANNRRGQVDKVSNVKLPTDLDYTLISGLSSAAAVRLEAERPRTIREAGALAEVRQSDIEILSLIVMRDDVSRETNS